MKPLALTMGDPAGIGGELTLRTWLALRGTGVVFVALDDPEWLAYLAKSLGLAVPIQTVARAVEAGSIFRSALPVLVVPLASVPVPGRPDPANAKAVVDSIERATRLALDGDAPPQVLEKVGKLKGVRQATALRF